MIILRGLNINHIKSTVNRQVDNYRLIVLFIFNFTKQKRVVA
jgi:hypothetical protein